jgi:rubrerythrin
MDIGSLFFTLGLFLLVVVFIARPFLERKSTYVSSEEHQLSSLLAEQERLINALQELDFDQKLGKIPEIEYPAQRKALLVRAAEVVRQIETLNKATSGEDVAARVEAGVTNQRMDSRASIAKAGKRTVQVDVAPDDEIEAMIAARRRTRSEKAAGFCHQCGMPILVSDRFCPRCGATLMVEETQEDQ